MTSCLIINIATQKHLRRCHGFSMVELVTVIVIAGVLAAVAAPRLISPSGFASRGFHDQVIATLRYAQKVAISQHQFVCIAFTSSSMTLSTGSVAACGTPLVSPETGAAPYVVSNTSAIAFTAVPATLLFDALGRPRDAAGVLLAANRSININGYALPITIERETGYVHQ